MPSGKIVPFDELSSADLVVDAVYQSGRKGNHSDDPISHILKVSNQGGFRYRGSIDSLDLVALVSSLYDPDWPDTIDRESGTFIYFGDNKRPGRGLHETLRFGNELLRRFFENAHSESTDRNKIPPIFVFAKTGEWRARYLPRRSVSGHLRFRENQLQPDQSKYRPPHQIHDGRRPTLAAKRNGKTIAAKPRPRGENVVDLMDALKKSIATEAPAKGKKSRKVSAGQKEMQMPIEGKKTAKGTAAKKSSAKQRKSA